MDDAAVVAGLVARELGFFFQDEQPHSRMRRSDFERGGEAEDAATDNRQVVLGGHQTVQGSKFKVQGRKPSSDVEPGTLNFERLNVQQAA